MKMDMLLQTVYYSLSKKDKIENLNKKYKIWNIKMGIIIYVIYLFKKHVHVSLFYLCVCPIREVHDKNSTILDIILVKLITFGHGSS